MQTRDFQDEPPPAHITVPVMCGAAAGKQTRKAPARRAILGSLCMLGLLVLGSCASLSERECRSANWGEIGRQDGREGHALDRLAEHTDACRKLNIAPDEPLWRAGREEGLKIYCTALNGREVGARGAAYRGVCLGPADDAFRRGFQVGRQIHELNQLLASNNNEQQRLINRLAQKDVPDTERRAIRQRLVVLDIDEDRLRRMVDSANRMPLSP